MLLSISMYRATLRKWLFSLEVEADAVSNYQRGAFTILKPRELCEKAWQEIASKFPDFKVVSKGQKLKKTSKNKDLIFEIYFQANRNNYADSVEFVPHIAIYSKSMEKANIHNGFVYGGELGRLLNRTEWHWY